MVRQHLGERGEPLGVPAAPVVRPVRGIPLDQAGQYEQQVHRVRQRAQGHVEDEPLRSRLGGPCQLVGDLVGEFGQRVVRAEALQGGLREAVAVPGQPAAEIAPVRGVHAVVGAARQGGQQVFANIASRRVSARWAPRSRRLAIPCT
ncbi:hypothetical protein [Streptomyces nojiriensis]|uniref:hypothetical protein n=1 Tax=Streptomyces nojiriensis TaxID=66374 RepID=UPI003651AB50